MNHDFLSEEEKRILIHIAINQVFESYEFYQTAQTLRSAGVKLGKSYDKFESVKNNVSSSLGSFYGKFGKKVQTIKKQAAEKQQKMTEHSPKLGEATVEVKQFTEELNHKVDDLITNLSDKKNRLKETSKAKYNQTFTHLLERLEDWVNKVFNALIGRYTPGFILAKAREVFPDKQFQAPSDFYYLSEDEHKKLREVFYMLKVPYWDSFNPALIKSTNLFLGAVSQIPMVGPLAGVINMIKTLVLLSKNICDYSASYGKAPASVQSLNYLSFMILKSMNSYELNSDHVPLDFKIINSLYEPDVRFKINDVFKQIIIKDAYITVPIIGVLSLKKIDFDDFKQELKIQSLFQDYFRFKLLTDHHSEKDLAEALDHFKAECRTIKDAGFLKDLFQRFQNKNNQFKEYIFENHEFAKYARSKICEKILHH